MFVNSNGIVIDCPILPTGSRLPLKLSQSETKPDLNWVIIEGNGHGTDEVFIKGYSPISILQKDYKEFQIPPWFIFVWQSSEELFAPMDNMFIWICAASFFSAFLILLMGSSATEKIVNPIKIYNERLVV